MEIEKENIKQKIEDSKNKLIQEYENKRKENKGVNNEIILNDKQKEINNLQKEILDLKFSSLEFLQFQIQFITLRGNLLTF